MVFFVTQYGYINYMLRGRHKAIIWTNAEILLFGPLGANFSEILVEIYKFSLKKMHMKMSSGKWRPSCLGLNVLKVLLTFDCHACHVSSPSVKRAKKDSTAVGPDTLDPESATSKSIAVPSYSRTSNIRRILVVKVKMILLVVWQKIFS